MIKVKAKIAGTIFQGDSLSGILYTILPLLPEEAVLSGSGRRLPFPFRSEYLLNYIAYYTTDAFRCHYLSPLRTSARRRPAGSVPCRK